MKPTPGSSPGSPPPWVDEAVRAEGPPQLGSYRVGPLLGQGGMGQVFEGWDTFLQRPVALKLLHREDPEALMRFQEEARLQARLRHPNICPLIEVNLDGERPLLVMPRLEGPTLDKAGLDREELLGVFETIARTVHAAHEAGLLHRDLKPSNIMLEREADGSWHPYVMDFGLAKDLARPLTSRSQVGLGTPAFAAPEQLRGLGVGTRADVFSLGATWYYLLAGKPLEWKPAETLDSPLDAPPTRRYLQRHIPDLPEDLAVILATCLAPDPQDRYPTALALAEDVARFRGGLPIQARPEGRFGRLKRRVRHHPRAFLALVASFLLLTGAGVAISVRVRSQSRQLQLVQRFGRQAEQAEAALRTALLQPPHDLGPELARIREQVRAMEAETARLPNHHQAPGHLAAGRVLLALGELEPALDHLQRAQALGDRSPQLAQSLGCALGAQFERELQSARLAVGEVGRRSLEEQLRTRTLGPIEDLLSQALAGGDVAYLQALLTHYRGQEIEALRLSREVLVQDPGRLEAHHLLVQAFLGLARQQRKAGNIPGVRKTLDQAEMALNQARSLAGSDGTLVCLASDLDFLRGLVDLVEGHETVASGAFQAAAAQAESGLALHSHETDLYLRLARALYFKALTTHDPEPSLAEAETWASRLIEARAFEGEAQRLRGRILLLRAEREPANERAQALLTKAEQALDRAATLGQPAEETHVRVLLQQAQILRSEGRDPAPCLRQALHLAEAAHAKWGDQSAKDILSEVRAAHDKEWVRPVGTGR